MIAGIFHQGSGLGNQLHRYVATRVLAERLGVDFGMIDNADGSGKENGFKGKMFMPADLGQRWEVQDYRDVVRPLNMSVWQEKKVVENGVDIRSYDPEFNFIEDGTIIDGEFQDERYWKDHDIDSWLKVAALDMPDDLCVIGFRGGEFQAIPELYLTKDYWEDAIIQMKAINPDMQFEVHTDDPQTAKEMFPEYEVIHDIGINWRAMRYAKYAIIANSSFYILPRWLSGGKTIAPKFWARRNTKVWALPQNYYARFDYI